MRNRIGSFAILGLGAFLIIRVGLNVANLYNAGGRLTEEEKRLVELEKENLQLKEKFAQVQTPEYMEREAREKLGMGKDGEVVVIIPPEEIKIPDDKAVKGDEQEPNWVKWRKLYLGW